MSLTDIKKEKYIPDDVYKFLADQRPALRATDGGTHDLFLCSPKLGSDPTGTVGMLHLGRARRLLKNRFIPPLFHPQTPSESATKKPSRTSRTDTANGMCEEGKVAPSRTKPKWICRLGTMCWNSSRLELTETEPLAKSRDISSQTRRTRSHLPTPVVTRSNGMALSTLSLKARLS